VPTTGRAGSLRYEWFLVQDSTLGVVFRKSSGVKQHRRDPVYDGDIELAAVAPVHAVELRALTFNEWRELTGIFVVTRVQDYAPGDRFELDPRWDEGWDPIQKHLISILFVSRVLDARGSIVEPNWEGIARFAARISSEVTIDDVKAGLEWVEPDSTDARQ
jgi:hypothetical protein